MRTLLVKINSGKVWKFDTSYTHQREIMVYKIKGKFVLDIDDLQKIVNDILKEPRNKDVKITTKKSDNKNSKSLYLFISIDGETTALRISDHNCKGSIRQMIVVGSTGKANVYYKIESAIKELRYKKLLRALGR